MFAFLIDLYLLNTMVQQPKSRLIYQFSVNQLLCYIIFKNRNRIVSRYLRNIMHLRQYISNMAVSCPARSLVLLFRFFCGHKFVKTKRFVNKKLMMLCALAATHIYFYINNISISFVLRLYNFVIQLFLLNWLPSHFVTSQIKLKLLKQLRMNSSMLMNQRHKLTRILQKLKQLA